MTRSTFAPIDAHAHVFPAVRGHVQAGPTRGLGHGRMARGPETVQLTPDLGEETAFSPAWLLAGMTAAGVERAVLLQGPLYGECNDFAVQAVRAYPGRLAAQAYLDPWVAGWEERLEAILQEEAFRGVKIEFSVPAGLGGLHPGARLDEAHLEPLWGALERGGRVLTLDLGAVGTATYQTDAVRRLAAGHPGLSVVICHLGQPGPAVLAEAARRREWVAQVRLGQLASVYFDTATLPVFFRDQGDPFPGCREVLRRAVDLVGPEKVLWGTDAPGALTLCPYERYAELARLHTDFLPPAQQEQILSANARRVYFAPHASR
ncbi:MAG: amidohydrolase family protein [Candidatus Latescibacterota bacterium]